MCKATQAFPVPGKRDMSAPWYKLTSFHRRDNTSDMVLLPTGSEEGGNNEMNCRIRGQRSKKAEREKISILQMVKTKEVLYDNRVGGSGIPIRGENVRQRNSAENKNGIIACGKQKPLRKER